MMRRFRFALLSYVFAMFIMLAGCSEMKVGSNAMGNRIRLEHVAINVEDPVSMARWYSHHLGMKVVRKGPPPINMHFISDAGGNMMLEIYHNPSDAVPDYASMDPLLLHIAFMVDDVKGTREKLISAGATPVGEVTVTTAGDELAMMRDPWGVPIQFVKRAKPMLRN